MGVRFSEDVVPLARMKVNPGKVMRQVEQGHRPVLLTSHGRGIAVVQSLGDFEKAQEEREFMRAVAEGMAAGEAGRTKSLAQVKKKFGLA
jgi:prevent-host-death family protein